jgi:hypothetical protein
MKARTGNPPPAVLEEKAPAHPSGIDEAAEDLAAIVDAEEYGLHGGVRRALTHSTSMVRAAGAGGF